MRRQVIAPLAAGVLLALSGAAQAASTKTASFTVSASVGKNCVISAGDLALGEFVGDNDLFAESDITVRCTAGTTFDIALSAGNTGSFAGRRMVGPEGGYLVYNLYTADTYATVWGDGTNSTAEVSGTGAGMAAANELTRTVYGRLLASQNDGPVEEGVYSDTIVATITY